MTTTANVPSMVRSLELAAWGGPAALKVVERALPAPVEGEVVVKVAASPVNPSDVWFTKGEYGIRKPLPTVPGFEGSGVVVGGQGPAAQALVGKRVAFAAADDRPGTWAEYCVTKATLCFPLRDDVDDEQGAMIFVNPLTAWGMLLLAKDGGHKAIVHTAAASALGRWLAVLAREKNVDVIHVVRRPEQVALVKGDGNAYVLDTSAEGFDAALRALAKERGATLGLDAVAGDIGSRVLKAMPRGAQLHVYGALSEKPVVVDPGDLIFLGKSVHGLWLSQFFKPKWIQGFLEGAAVIQRHIAEGKRTSVQARVDLAGLPAAMEHYVAHMTDGKVLLKV